MHPTAKKILDDYAAYQRASSREPHQRGPPATEIFIGEFHAGDQNLFDLMVGDPPARAVHTDTNTGEPQPDQANG